MLNFQFLNNLSLRGVSETNDEAISFENYLQN